MFYAGPHKTEFFRRLPSVGWPYCPFFGPYVEYRVRSTQSGHLQLVGRLGYLVDIGLGLGRRRLTSKPVLFKWHQRSWAVKYVLLSAVILLHGSSHRSRIDLHFRHSHIVPPHYTWATLIRVSPSSFTKTRHADVKFCFAILHTHHYKYIRKLSDRGTLMIELP